ncbi:MAG: outer membrane beta-barrel protein [Pseudomonadota bacterium]
MSSTIKRTTLFAAALAAGIALPGVANAADLLMDPPVVEAPEIITKSGGWYIRGDISYDFRSTGNPTYNLPGNGGVTSFTSGSVDDSFNIGIGIGYQVNDYFRADLTGEYIFESDFRGSTAGICPDPDAGDGLPGAPCVSSDSSSYTTFKLLANAYFDLGHYNGFSPYVGAGIGGAHIDWDGLTNVANCTTTAGSSACPGVPEGYTATATGSTRTDQHGGADSWRFAWALHAGFAYAITEKTKIDFGYTYSRIEDGAMFSWLDGSGTQGYDDGFEDHTLRIGLRYQIW